MTCSTCHDVHETERDATELSTQCIACHIPEAASGKPLVMGALPQGHRTFAGGVRTCVDCHMPLRPSRLIRMADGDRTLAPSYRTHRIAIYSSGGRPGAPGS
ncbi:MAG: cytochrome c3 family protein [Vicinamibacterales bacterium]